MVTNQHPLQHAPVDTGREKALHRAITAPFVGPARHASHGHPSGHGQHRFRHPTELAQGGGIETLA